MRYLSICSGIEAASVAWKSLGWGAAAFAEIEKFPSAVLAYHYPDVPNLGDMTKYKEWNVGHIDIIVGGTPCQAFSVAGKRRGLADERGNLSLVFCEMVAELKPKWVVWENVPGVLSSKDNAFGCFLAGLVGESEAFVPAKGKWPTAGLVIGPERTAAWRVLDAQHFGVPQRRRRVFVCSAIRSTGDWTAADALFPQSAGSDGHTAPSKKQEQNASSSAYVCFDRQRSDEFGTTDIASTLSARDYKSATDLVAPVYLGNAEGGALNLPFLTCHNLGGTAGISNQTPLIQHTSGVRRLTPTECERLQGFPDGWTDIKPDGKPTPDGPRYKALGNSMAVPCMAWIGKHIAEVEAACTQ